MENSAAQFFIALAICAAFTTIANARACSDTQGAPGATGNVVRLEKSANAMGTTYILDLYGTDRSVLQAAAQEAFDELHKLDQMLSNYISGSELSRVNDHAADGPLRVSQEFFDLLNECVHYSRDSEGTFDITVGPLMKVWGFYKDSGHLANPAEIRAALTELGYQNVELDAANLTVRFRKHGMNLDPGGVGKGYAVDRIVAILRKAGICSGLVSAGGSSIYAIGAPPSDSKGWRIRIRDPRTGNKTASEAYLKNTSISTSGSSEKFFWAERKRYSHIMDPRTGYPAEGMLSVSVIAPKTLDSEIWAKPYYILGRVWTQQHKPARFRVFMCDDKPNAPCAWLP
jgi:thiamine biosynthesis lipoprotein